MSQRAVRLLWLALVTAALLTRIAQGLWIPGMAPTAHKDGSHVRVEVNDLRSSKNLLQYDFYDRRLPFASLRPAFHGGGKLRKYSSDTGLAALLSGERHQWSPYILPAAEYGCFYLRSGEMKKEQIKRTIKLINRRYRVQMLVDGLPAISNGTAALSRYCTNSRYKARRMVENYQHGYYLGLPAVCDELPLLNNHVHFVITYYRLSKEEAEGYKDVNLGDGSSARRGSRWSRAHNTRKRQSQPSDSEFSLVVGVSVEPFSVDWQSLKERGEVDYRNVCVVINRAFNMTRATAQPRRSSTLAFMQDNDDTNGENTAEKPERDSPEDGYQGGDAGRDDPDFDDDDDEETAPDVNNEAYDEAEAGNYYDDDLGEDPQSTLDYSNAFFFPDSLESSMKLTLPPNADEKTAITVHWTYSVEWRNDQSIKWATRWDAYFKRTEMGMRKSTYMAFLLLSSAVIITLLSFLTTILVRSLRRDLLKSMPVFLSPEDELWAQEQENGWKALRGDVFRPPERANHLAIAVGAGAQALLTLVAATAFGLLGFVSPANRGGLAGLLLSFSLISAFVGGAVGAALSSALGQPKQWSTIAGLVFGFSGSVLTLFACVNLVLCMTGSSGALPFSATVSLYSLWLFIHCPLSFAGATIGFRLGCKPTVKVTAVQRVIAYENVWSLFRPPGVLWYSGAPPFSVCLLLLVNIYNGIYGGATLYIFGFVCVAGALWLVSCALTAVSVVYHNLCGENYRWQWLSFWAPSSGGLPLLLFTAYYFFDVLRTTSVSGILIYTLYSAFLTYVYVLVAGSVGFLSSFAFVTYIYSSAKRD